MIKIQQVFFYFDDSGVFHKNEQSGHFVYAGYVFLNRLELDRARRRYINANRAIRDVTGMVGELKASRLEAKHKRSLFNSVRKYESISAVVDLSRVYSSILDDKKSRCRFKDYAIKLCVKRKLEDLISRGLISSSEDIEIQINVDEQLTASNGYYDLRSSIVEELRHGIENFNYGTFHPPIFTGEVTVHVHFCESKNNYMIQASDILANRIWSAYRSENWDLLKKTNHMMLTLP